MKEKIKSFFKNKQNVKKILLGFALVIILIVTTVVCIVYNNNYVRVPSGYPVKYIDVEKIYKEDNNVYLNYSEFKRLPILYNNYNSQFIIKKVNEDSSSWLNKLLGNHEDSEIVSVKEFIKDSQENGISLKFTTDGKQTYLVYKVNEHGDSPLYRDKINVTISNDDKIACSTQDFYTDYFYINVDTGESFQGYKKDQPSNIIQFVRSSNENEMISEKPIDEKTKQKLNVIESSVNGHFYYMTFYGILNASDELNDSEGEENPNADSDGFIELPNELEIDN